MGVYLDSKTGYTLYSNEMEKPYFVDKSLLLKELFPLIDEELKVNHTPEEAISQIKEKQYALKFEEKLGETRKYTGRVLAVGIGYDKTTKKHLCKVEVLS